MTRHRKTYRLRIVQASESRQPAEIRAEIVRIVEEEMVRRLRREAAECAVT
jgi:hypothetical protein